LVLVFIDISFSHGLACDVWVKFPCNVRVQDRCPFHALRRSDRIRAGRDRAASTHATHGAFAPIAGSARGEMVHAIGAFLPELTLSGRFH